MALTARIEKRFGAFQLAVDLMAETGQPLALLGASGCGKSVTLKCIAGIERPDRGRIELDGRVLFDSEAGIDLPPQRRRVGFLFQSYALFPHMTVERNVAVCLGRMDKRRRRERTAELLALLHLEDQAALYPRQLSGGQRQRAALARILAAEPGVLLLDEPFSALDSFLKWQLEQELREVLERFPGPAVWVSHDRGEVYRNCSRVCVLEDGKSAPAASMAELMANPGTVAAAGLVEVPAWGLVLRAPWREGAAALGLRADRVRPEEAGAVNAFPCQVVRVTEDVSSVFAALRPEAASPGAPPLWMELAKDAWAALPDRERLWAAVRPEDLMLLK